MAEKIKKKNPLLLFPEWCELLLNMEEKQAGMIIQSVAGHHIGIEKPLNDEEKLLLSISQMIISGVDANNQKYADICEKRRQARIGKVKDDEISNDNNSKQVLSNDNNSEQNGCKYNLNFNSNLNFNNSISEIIDLYNKRCPSLPKASKNTDKRERLIKARLKEYSKEDLERAFIIAENSDFLSGRSGVWKASLDWILNPNNIVKILEGNYSSDAKQNIPSAEKVITEDREQEKELWRIFEDCKANYPSEKQAKDDYHYFLEAISSDSFDLRKEKATRIKLKIRSMTDYEKPFKDVFREVLLC